MTQFVLVVTRDKVTFSVASINVIRAASKALQGATPVA